MPVFKVYANCLIYRVVDVQIYVDRMCTLSLNNDDERHVQRYDDGKHEKHKDCCSRVPTLIKSALACYTKIERAGFASLLPVFPQPFVLEFIERSAFFLCWPSGTSFADLSLGFADIPVFELVQFGFGSEVVIAFSCQGSRNPFLDKFYDFEGEIEAILVHVHNVVGLYQVAGFRSSFTYGNLSFPASIGGH